MKVYLRSIDGIPSAIESMYMSKRTWTPEKGKDIWELCERIQNNNGFYRTTVDRTDLEEFNRLLNIVTKMTVNHITVGRFIDFTFVVEGLHRGGQDDFDAHTKRFENRIIRSSTRLAKYNNEKSKWYEGKILTLDDLLEDMTFPDSIIKDGVVYVKTVNGYIREDLKDNKDVLRGLYPLSIPSNFIFKCNLTEFAHIYKERRIDGTANPELKVAVELMVDAIQSQYKQFSRKLLLEIKN